MPQQGAFATPAATHDDKNIAALHAKGEIVLNHQAPIGHGQIFHDDVRVLRKLCRHAFTIPRRHK
jgi:hypothetical protein